jgi:S-adenosylmethionine hydrolase
MLDTDMIDYNVSSRIISLTTDFGLSGHYVGVMKGVIASMDATLRVIDICHEIPAYSVAEGAFVIAQSCRFFPAGTVHVVVVDPGVGTSRRAIVVESGGHYFVAPDNGVLSQVYEQGPLQPHVIDVERHALQPMSRTFHGRDVFAPVAARLAAGRPIGEFGEPAGTCVQLPSTIPEETVTGRWLGRILTIDPFGNIVTSFREKLLPPSGTSFLLLTGKLEVSTRAEAYGEAELGAAFAIVGSSGYIEVSAARQSAAKLAEVKVGDPVELILL